MEVALAVGCGGGVAGGHRGRGRCWRVMIYGAPQNGRAGLAGAHVSHTANNVSSPKTELEKKHA